MEKNPKKIGDSENSDDFEYLFRMYREITGDKSELVSVKVCVDGIKEYFENIIACMPGNVFWMDKNCVYLGCNDNVVKALGLSSRKDIIGKTDEDLEKIGKLTPGQNKKFKNDDLEVIATGKPKLNIEDPGVKTADGREVFYLTSRVPLFDNKKSVTGLAGISVDITSEKENEALKLENAKHKFENAQHKERLKIADTVSHDIRSPARTICTMVENNAEKLPEDIRVPLREMAARIVDVASSMISRYEKGSGSGLEEQQTVIASLSLMQILSEKKIQTADPSVSFTSDYSRESIFACIKVQSSNFKRMISNLLNNAVEALEGGKGKIHLGLNLDDAKKDIKITIQDNGKGMSEEIANKIKNGDTVETDKQDGHGIGLTQIRETIKQNRGKFDIVSKLGEGTKMILTFPMTITPPWLAKEIKLNKGDTAIVLDDDMAIHSTMDFYFKEHAESVTLRHFILGSEAISFINASNEKNKIFLLTDYELIKQKVTGIDVIKQTNLFERSILVTSHYADVKFQKQAVEIGVKILPKDIVLDATIKICEDDTNCVVADRKRVVDVAIIEDDDMLGSTVTDYLKSYGIIADLYRKPEDLLNNVHIYPKDKLIVIDNTYENSPLKGIEVAKQLHEDGYTNLCLFSGTKFEKHELPEYLKAILKTDIDGLMEIINKEKKKK